MGAQLLRGKPTRSLRAVLSSSLPLRNHSGQAMVETVIILTILMTLCSGMIYFNRLLSFDYWALQDARFLAYEQTWVPAWAGIDGSGTVQNHQQFHRPELVQQLSVQRDVEDDGDVSGILPLVFKDDDEQEEVSDTRTIEERSESPIMVAKAASKSSIWTRTTEEWIDSSLELVAPAYASQRRVEISAEGNDSLLIEPPAIFDPINNGYYVDHDLTNGLRRVFESVQLGESACDAMRGVAVRYGMAGPVSSYQRSKCAAQLNADLALEIAENTDLMDFFRDYEFQIRSGFDRERGLQETVDNAIAQHFYSQFDDYVKLGQNGALPYLGVKIFELASEVPSDPSVLRMTSEMRYIGSAAAIAALTLSAIGDIIAIPLGAINADIAYLAEQLINGITHPDVAPVAFFLSPAYLPVPPTFGALAGGLQSGLMKNVLDQDTDLWEDLIEESNKKVHVEYDSEGGVFEAARRRFKTENRSLKANYYLVTQPWHITRRVSPFGAFRELGDQFDDIDEDTYEGILRRRVFGLWLFPSRPGALLDPLTQLPGVGGALFAPVASIVGTFDGFISIIKSFIFNNPLIEVADALSNIPVLGSLVPTLPKWPAVRPEAYPRSKELKNDHLMGGSRNFQDYVDEQEQFNPEPRPTFN